MTEDPPRSASQERLSQTAVAVGPDDERLGVALSRKSDEGVGYGHLVGNREPFRLEAGLTGQRSTVLGKPLRAFIKHPVDLRGGADVDRRRGNAAGARRELHHLVGRLAQRTLGSGGAVEADDNWTGAHARTPLIVDEAVGQLGTERAEP